MVCVREQNNLSLSTKKKKNETQCKKVSHLAKSFADTMHLDNGSPKQARLLAEEWKIRHYENTGSTPKKLSHYIKQRFVSIAPKRIYNRVL